MIQCECEPERYFTLLTLGRTRLSQLVKGRLLPQPLRPMLPELPQLLQRIENIRIHIDLTGRIATLSL